MKFIEPSVEYWQQEAGLQGIWKQIARATRVCYQSQQRANETDEEFVKRVILKPALVTRKVVEPNSNSNGTIYNEYNFDKMHGAMLEHGTVYLDIKVPFFVSKKEDKETLEKAVLIQNRYKENKYSRTEYFCVEYPMEIHFLITTNMRVIMENNWFDDLQYICSPTEHHPKRYTFSVITDIGVTREMNRHRTFSIAEQSTRYCDFNKDKFGGELTFIRPAWYKKDYGYDIVDAFLDRKAEEIRWGDYSAWNEDDYYNLANVISEFTYNGLRKQGWKPEQARQVLPLGLKTQAVYTAFADDWEHFFALRADNVSGKSHPNMQYIAKEIKRIAKGQISW